MMKAYTKYIALLTGALMVWSCGGGSGSGESETLLNLKPSLSELSGASATESSFASNDVMGVYIVPSTSTTESPQATDKVFNKPYTYNGASWTTTGVSEWPDGDDGLSCSIYAYAPYAAGSAFFTHSFTCATDQSTTASLHQSDFVYGSTKASKSNTSVPITMNHAFAVVTINVAYGTGISDILSTVKMDAVTGANINLKTGDVTTSGSAMTISLCKLDTPTSGNDKSYECIIPAQNIDNNTCLTLKYNDGTTANVALTQNIEKGKHYSVNLSVIGKQEVLVRGITISKWDAEVSLTGGTVNYAHDYNTGDVITYMKNRTDNPVTIVVIPEGFTSKQLTYGGLFEQKATAAMDFFFNVEPYKTYKKYFNVYFIAAVSNEQGSDSIATDATHPAHLHDTYFDSGWEWDDNYNMTANDTKIFSFVTKYCPDIVNGKTTINKVAVFMIINDGRYGGITWTYADGKAFAMCPMTAGDLTWSGKNPSVTGYSKGDWRNTLLHEGGGHCFAKLTDEYWYDDSKTNTEKTISSHSWTVPMGLNVTADISDASTTYYWKFMVGTGTGKFSKEGAWEGADGYGKGMWRPENISCMIDNRRYFNAWSRYLIVKRIRDLAGETYTTDSFYTDFLAKDVNYDEILDSSSKSVIRRSAFTRTANMKLYPLLPHPILIDK
jgi:hypothetical protein